MKDQFIKKYLKRDILFGISTNVAPLVCALSCLQVDSSTESAEAACAILSQLVNCSLKTLGLISTARPSFMELPKVHVTLLPAI